MTPILGKDLVTLNMIEDIVVDGNKVSFTVRLTAPACPLKEESKTTVSMPYISTSLPMQR
jgi:metal-sulfur cluster biosynthetic enzyme